MKPIIFKVLANSHFQRRRSHKKTEECPLPDPLLGGFMESDELLRERIETTVEKEEASGEVPIPEIEL